MGSYSLGFANTIPKIRPCEIRAYQNLKTYGMQCCRRCLQSQKSKSDFLKQQKSGLINLMFPNLESRNFPADVSRVGASRACVPTVWTSKIWRSTIMAGATRVSRIQCPKALVSDHICSAQNLENKFWQSWHA